MCSNGAPSQHRVTIVDLDLSCYTLAYFYEAESMASRPEMRMADDRWLSVDEIADHLGVTKDSVYRWIERKGLPAHKLGKLWKFNKDEVDTWVRSG